MGEYVDFSLIDELLREPDYCLEDDEPALKKFIAESNMIEGITDYDEGRQVELYKEFLKLDKISITDLEELAVGLYESNKDKGVNFPVLRSIKGYNVMVGNHLPPNGGPLVKKKLSYLLNRANKARLRDVYKVHCKYEQLHPFTDCNGRTGRAIWAWTMNKNRYKFKIGFLHMWYYMSLGNFRDNGDSDG